MSSAIRPQDTATDRLTKLLPADVTAGFLSAKAGILALISNPVESAGPVFWTAIVILLLCPFYFWFVSKVVNVVHIVFLCLSFLVFAISIASNEVVIFIANVSPVDLSVMVNIVAIVLPIVWAFMITPIFSAIVGKGVEGS